MAFDVDAWKLASDIVHCPKCIEKLFFSKELDAMPGRQIRDYLIDYHKGHLKEIA
jgi:hypothetical protein